MNNLPELAKLIRYYILTSTTEAGSGHPTSSMSAADLMTVLMFGRSRNGAKEEGGANGREEAFFKFDISNPDYENNDRLIFSKGHASPLYYSLWAVAGQPINGHATQMKRAIEPEELMTLRKFGSRLEGHPTMEFPFTEVPTGSLGQGLSVGVGMALNAKLDKLSYNTFVLMGDSEVAEGSIWEAASAASFYKLNNLVGILDVNRLGQSRETMLGHDVETYKKRFEAFGWKAIVIDGHNFEEIASAFRQVGESADRPTIIIAKTLKGKGVSFLEDKPGKHGTAVKKEELETALKELGEVDKTLVGEVSKPDKIPNDKLQIPNKSQNSNIKFTDYPKDKPVATRRAYGNALKNIFVAHPNMVVLDGETSNSTFAEAFAKEHPENYIECFIAEQNMAGIALGLSRRGKIPFASTFAAFWSRAFDQIRMAQYANSNIKFIGSHAGVSIGEDGASQMGLEEIAMFRTLLDGVVLYPSDAVSTEKLVAAAAEHHGNVYIQTTRKDTTILYRSKKQEVGIKEDDGLVYHDFHIGGSCVLKSSNNDKATIIGAGITLYEALAAYEELKKEGINVRVIDLYSIKPLDVETLKKAGEETKNIITVEDNHPEGGIAEAVASALATSSSSSSSYKVASLAVSKMPHSGKPEELLVYEEINKNAIIKKVKQLIS